MTIRQDLSYLNKYTLEFKNKILEKQFREKDTLIFNKLHSYYMAF